MSSGRLIQPLQLPSPPPHTELTRPPPTFRSPGWHLQVLLLAILLAILLGVLSELPAMLIELVSRVLA